MWEFQPAVPPSHRETLPKLVLPTWQQPSYQVGEVWNPILHEWKLILQTVEALDTTTASVSATASTLNSNSPPEVAPLPGLWPTSVDGRVGLVLVEVQLLLTLHSCPELFCLMPSFFFFILCSIFMGQLFCTFLVWGTSLPEGNVYVLLTQSINISSISTPDATSYPWWNKAEITQKSGC